MCISKQLAYFRQITINHTCSDSRRLRLIRKLAIKKKAVVTESPTDKEEEEDVLFSHECDQMP